MKILFILLFILNAFSIVTQKKKTYFDKATTIEVTSGTDSINAMLDDYERIQLPPLSVFLESVYDHPSVRIYEAKRDEANADMKITKREWLDYFRVYGQYQYGRLVQLSTRETIEDPSFLTSIGSNQHTYSVGISVSIPFGDLFSRGQKVRMKKARVRQLDYEYEMSIEELISKEWRVCCLYRVSTLGQVEKDDIPMQKQYCREFVGQHPGWEIIKEFSEKGVSGFKVSAKDRDAIQEIQRDAL